MNVHFILYVKDQKKSSEFYSAVLKQKPDLDVPGMTEFIMNTGCILGLMPEKGIKKLLGDTFPDLAKAERIPRAEVYIRVDNPISYYKRALTLGAQELSPLKKRDWGDVAAYCFDLDGHILVFAKKCS